MHEITFFVSGFLAAMAVGTFVWLPVVYLVRDISKKYARLVDILCDWQKKI